MTDELRSIIGNPRNADEVILHTEQVCSYFYDNARTILILNRCHADTDINEVLYNLNQNFQMYRLSSKYTNSLNQTSLHLVSVFFYTGCYNILLEWLKKDLPLTPKEVADLMIRLASENFLE